MKHTLWVAVLGIFVVSCKKDHDPGSHTPPPPPSTNKKILLKDIVYPHLPNPYYHFEYNADSMATRVGFDDGLTMYDVLYSGNKISEMRNNTFANHDTLRYIYDNAGKVSIINFISDESHVSYRRAFFTYDGDHVTKIEWDHTVGNIGSLIDRTLTFTYYADDNVKTITEHRPAIDGSPESNGTWLYEKYDDNINVDDFDLIHDGIHDHLFLLQGFRLQKNNPAKETYTGNSGTSVGGYTVDYTYNYNNDRTPALRTGSLLYTAGAQAGQRFQVNNTFTYY